MRDLLTALIRLLRDSVLARLGLAMGTLAALTFVSILISTVIADSSSGKASAINLSGSLRMMSYRLLSEAQQPEKRRQMPATVEQYERRLDNLQRIIASRLDDNAELQAATGIVVEAWRSTIRPLVRAAGEGSPDALTELAREVPEFVDRIDRVVLLIEDDLEKRIRLLRATQFALLAVIIALSLLTSWMLRRYFVLPLADLLKAARSVARGAFTARVRHVGNDELGQLGLAFNTMIGEIAEMYAHLEDKVEAKTRELRRTNQSLDLLYRTSQQLAAPDLTLDALQAVLRDVERELELGHGMICLSEHGEALGRPLLGDLSETERAALCGQQSCGECLAQAARPLAEQAAPVLLVPLGERPPYAGVLPIIRPDELPRDKLRTIETVGRHIANALAGMRRADERHRLAVLEERAVIARELHDSIAQSLSYLKIQVARLEAVPGADPAALAIVRELRGGLNAAYRELRELITTFRLRIDERGLHAALQETVAEYSGKLGFAVGLDNRLAGVLLSGNEEMHVLRIVREALANVERHAGAQRVDIALGDEGGEVVVHVTDDGRGFDPQTIPPNHYGMSIMRDRAASLGGRFELATRPGGGTRLGVAFVPQKYLGARA